MLDKRFYVCQYFWVVVSLQCHYQLSDMASCALLLCSQ